MAPQRYGQLRWYLWAQSGFEKGRTVAEADDEDRKQRVDRELIELLNELRVALPGVQVIFGFLLTVPFAPRFEQIDREQRWSYLVTLTLLALASLLLIAPAAQHRVQFRQHDKEALLIRANRYSRAGLATLLPALSLGVFFVLDTVFPGRVAVLVAVSCLLAGGWWWLVLPQWQRSGASTV